MKQPSFKCLMLVIPSVSTLASQKASPMTRKEWGFSAHYVPFWIFCCMEASHAILLSQDKTQNKSVLWMSNLLELLRPPTISKHPHDTKQSHMQLPLRGWECKVESGIGTGWEASAVHKLPRHSRILVLPCG